ncbi:MAG: N-acetyl-gamma-glutamyl-phosphate reductase [Oscillospiraceae bacterium]|nr:N-acetyl-gamma-glutamyl-phosphate reductase [Oscillospiraceae bacterium]
MKIKVGIIGATGYTGNELLRLLMRHPKVEINALSSHSFEGKMYSEVYQNYTQLCETVLVSEDEAIEKSEVVFACLSSGLSEKIAGKCLGKKKLFIDLGSDLRLSDREEYKQWYGLDFINEQVHANAVYCIPELNRRKLTEIASAKTTGLIANPGCYPTAAALALAPLIDGATPMIDLNTIIIDAKSGVTGAGRTPSSATHFPELNEGLSAYKVAEHRHTPEIEQTLSGLAGRKVRVVFVPHLLPINRGILTTVYANALDTDLSGIRNIFADYYKNSGFVRILKSGVTANLKSVKYSNYCDISLHFDVRTNRVIIMSVIDNMIKGAAGQAIQNMNIALGLPENAGLDYIPPSF